MAYDNIPKVTGQSSLTYNGVVYWPITKWTTGRNSSYTWLGSATRILMGEDSTDGSYHLLAQYSLYVHSAINARRNIYRMIGGIGSSSNHTAYTSGSFFTSKTNSTRLYDYYVGTTGLRETSNPYTVENLGSIACGVSKTSSTFNCTFYPDSAYTASSSATWAAPPTVSLSFNTTAQSGGSIPAIATQTVYPTMAWNATTEQTDATYTATLPSATSSDSNYTFIGWTVDGVDYNAGVTVTLTEDTTAYPRFSRNAISFSISVNGTVTQYTDQSIGSTITPTIPSGYTLAGWMLGVSNAWVSAPTITGGTVTVDGDWAGQTLCAVFSFTFNYKDEDDSAIGSDVKYAQRKLDSYLRAQPYKLGYMFNGWAKTGGSTYQGGALYPIADLGATQTFTAQWLAASWVPVLMFKKTTAS